MKSRVPSVEDWLELVAGRLLDGEKLLLKSLPGLGKTYVCQRLAHIFGPSVVHVRGRRIIAADFGTSANEIANELRSTVEKEGCAQLLFDDYGAALTSPVGQRLQATLHGLLVDSADADRIGALVTARSDVPHVSRGISRRLRVLRVGAGR